MIKTRVLIKYIFHSKRVTKTQWKVAYIAKICRKHRSFEIKSNLPHTVQHLMSSKGANRTIFYHITVILQYYWDKTIARSWDMYRDDSGTFSKSLNVSASQTLRYKIISLLEFHLLKLCRSVCGNLVFLKQIVVFIPCNSHLSKIFRKSCDIFLNPSFCTFIWHEALYSVYLHKFVQSNPVYRCRWRRIRRSDRSHRSGTDHCHMASPGL